MPVSALNLLVDSFLPEDLRDPRRIYDKKGIDRLLTAVAQRYPDRYPEIAKRLGDIGRKQAYYRGETFRLSDFKPVFDRSGLFAELQARENEIRKTVHDPKEQRAMIGDLFAEYSTKLSKLTNEQALAQRNNIALTVLSGARGKEAQLRDMIASPGYYSDGAGGVIPWFVSNSFAEGVRPADLMAGSYAARGAVTDAKRATAKGGFLAKTLSRAASTHTITKEDCGTSNGIDLPTDEPDIRGRVLQREAAGHPVGTVITRKVLSDLKAAKVPEVIVRSPLTCSQEHGLCSKCYGVRAEGKFPKIGDHVGITASNALGEPLTQQALSTKHVTSGKGKTEEFSGLDYIQQFMDSPEEFRDRAATAKLEGRVDQIVPAPQGGNYIMIGGQEHYVPVGRNIQVKVGESVEAGDQLTDGLVDAEDILKYKGLGAARRYWVDRMNEMAKASSAGMDLRHFEVLARANVDHVDLDDPLEDGFLPDDRVRYSQYVNRRQLPEKVMQVRPHQAVGKWLEAPVLHHTVGTKITPRVAEELEKKGFNQVHVSEQEPAFHPVFVRLQQVAATDDDWLASLGGSYLGSQLQQGIMRAQDTNIEENYHPVPRLAVGVGYGDKIEQTGKF